MDGQQGWLRIPAGRDAAPWMTTRIQRKVLAVVHTVAGAGHLLDAVELLESDPRIQVVFTHAPDLFSNGVEEFIRDLRVVAIPWHQAIHTEFDLALATDSPGVYDLPAPVLHLPHGVMNNKLQAPAAQGQDRHLVVGLAAPWLTWYGRLVPAAVALSHAGLAAVLAQQCPQALPVATVTGDLCFDRLVASRPGRAGYRRALGVQDGQTLVAVTSTWGPESLLGRSRQLLFDLVAGLPGEEYRVAVTMHPAVWFGHGPRQVMGWLSAHRRRGLLVVDPQQEWRGLAAAADVVIGDHGSTTIYAAGSGVPVLRAPRSAEVAKSGTAAALLADTAPVLTAGPPLEAQLREAVGAFHPEAHRVIAEQITSEPGRAARLLRREMYRLLALAEPTGRPETAPVAAPRLVSE